MSDPNPKKSQAECDLVRSFLQGRHFSFSNIRPGPDPPDVIVERGGSPSLEIELTKYDPEWDRIGSQVRSDQFRETLDRLVSSNDELRGIDIGFSFLDLGTPGRSVHREIAEEFVRFVSHALRRGWIPAEVRNFQFSDEEDLDGEWFVVRATSWPILANYIDAIHLHKTDYDAFFPCSNLPAQWAMCSPRPDAFAILFSRKEEAIKSAIACNKYRRSSSPLWLLVESDNSRNLASFIFRDPHLRKAVYECGFDLSSSLFDEVWLLNLVDRGRSQRLFPWEE